VKNPFFVQGARNQILTIDELLHNAEVKMPLGIQSRFRTISSCVIHVEEVKWIK